MQAGSPSSASAAAFTGDDRFVADYFRSELISRLPDDEARFLKQTSVLERMCGGLCDSVVDSSGSADVLERLERANSFVVPLDRRGEWYRYHHLFAELLRTELERAEPDVGRRAQPPGDGVVHRPRSARRPPWSTDTPPARPTPSPALSMRSRCRPTTTAGWRPWRGG